MPKPKNKKNSNKSQEKKEDPKKTKAAKSHQHNHSHQHDHAHDDENTVLPEYTRKDESPTEVQLDITVPADQFEEVYTQELKEIAKDVDIKGFRKGKAPLDMVEKSKGREVIENVLRKLMPVLTVSVLKEEDLQPVIPVTYRVLSIEDKDDIRFRAVVALIPDVEIPDLSKVEVDKEDIEVEEKEIEAVIKRLWEDHRGDAENKDDNWVKGIAPKLGFEAKSMKELKDEIKKSIKTEKKRITEQKYGNEVLKKAIELSDLEVPEAAVEFEMEEREKTFRQQLEQINASVEQFCKIKGVTMEELKQQWHKDSHDALENDVFLSKYAEKRDIEVTEDELEEEIDRIKKRSEAQAQAAQAQAQAQKGGAKAQPQQPGGNQEMYDNPQWQAYIRRVLLKRKSYQGLLKEVEESK